MIDVHAHFTLPHYDSAAVAKKLKANHFLSAPVENWSPTHAIDFMNRNEIVTQMLSIPGELPTKPIRRVNEFGASLVSKNPKRFGFLAALPMLDSEASLSEIGYALDTLHVDGFALVTNYSGTYLGDPRFDSIFRELDRRQATVFLHPETPAGFDCVACGRPSPVIEFPFDTCRTVTDMMFANFFERFSNIKLILAHGGGVLPSLAMRIATFGTLPWVPNPHHITPEKFLNPLRHIYYDTALAGFQGSLAPILDIAGASQIVFGTDFPMLPDDAVQMHIRGLASIRGLTQSQLFSNARKLFARLRSADFA